MCFVGVCYFFCKPRKLYTKLTFKEAKVIKSKTQELGNCITRAACTLFFNLLYMQTVQLPARGTIFDRAQCLNHSNDDYVCSKNKPGHYNAEKLISTGNKLWQSWTNKAANGKKGKAVLAEAAERCTGEEDSALLLPWTARELPSKSSNPNFSPAVTDFSHLSSTPNTRGWQRKTPRHSKLGVSTETWSFGGCWTLNVGNLLSFWVISQSQTNPKLVAVLDLDPPEPHSFTCEPGQHYSLSLQGNCKNTTQTHNLVRIYRQEEVRGGLGY